MTSAAPLADRPLRDLGLVRTTTPDILLRAASAPYAQPASPPCRGARAELADLDAALGPDVDAPAPDAGSGATALMQDAARGFFDIPHRGALRLVSGAAARDRALTRAITAGTARRGFLKGLLQGLVCSPGIAPD